MLMTPEQLSPRKKKLKKTKIINFPQRLANRLENAAEQLEKSESQLIRDAVSEYLDRIDEKRK